MTRPVRHRAVAVAAAALCGGATAFGVAPDDWPSFGRPAVLSEHTASAAPEAVRTQAGSGSAAPEAVRTQAGVGPVAPEALPAQPGSGSTAPEASVAGAQPAPAAAPDTEPAGPDRVVLERLGVDLPVVPQGIDLQGQMALPEDPGVAGWYRFGPAPASAAGAVVVAAHVDSRERGIGPFARLSRARPGDGIVVEAGGRQWRYAVTQVVEVAKDDADLARVFAREGAPRLHLVTCTGRYDAASGYEANLVVVADRAEPAA